MLRIEEIDEAMSVLGVQKDQETYKILIHAYLSVQKTIPFFAELFQGKNIVKAEKAFYTYRKEIETKDPELYRLLLFFRNLVLFDSISFLGGLRISDHLGR